MGGGRLVQLKIRLNSAMAFVELELGLSSAINDWREMLLSYMNDLFIGVC